MLVQSGTNQGIEPRSLDNLFHLLGQLLARPFGDFAICGAKGIPRSPIQHVACKLLIYIDYWASINGNEYVYAHIRNEKVGCSIHLSGTKLLNRNNALSFAGQCVVLLF